MADEKAISELVENFKTRWLAGALSLEETEENLKSLEPEQRDKVRAYLYAWMELKRIDGTMDFLDRQLSREESLSRLKNRIKHNNDSADVLLTE